ncbi:MAG: zinc ribbon domain-containing protein [Muribaculaceae bacterium]|nr:zinc ribbon domain-containing protein [Muribaculaceae bacterium]
MKFCIKCGNQLSDDASFCSSCGTKQGHEEITSVNDQVITSDLDAEIMTASNEIQLEESQIETALVENETEDKEWSMSPLVSILSTIATLIIFSIVAQLLDLKVDQIFAYILYVIAGFAILAFMGATMNWTELNGKNVLSKISYVVGALALLFLGSSCLHDLYLWFFD